MSDNDDFDGVFDNLSPNDFDRTSARHVAVLKPQTFKEFVTAGLETLRYAYHAADGLPNPVAVMVGPAGRRLYTPDDDENLGQYIARLGREARTHQVTRLFTAWLTEGGFCQGTADSQRAADSTEMLDSVRDAGAMQEVLYWYAQDGKEIQHGIMLVSEDQTGDVVGGASEHASPLYRSILSG